MSADEPVAPTCKVTTIEQRWERRKGTLPEVVDGLVAQGWQLVARQGDRVLLTHPSLAGVQAVVEP